MSGPIKRSLDPVQAKAKRHGSMWPVVILCLVPGVLKISEPGENTAELFSDQDPEMEI